MSGKKRGANQMKASADAHRPKAEPATPPAAPAAARRKKSPLMKRGRSSPLAILAAFLLYRKFNPTPPKQLPPKPLEQEKQWTSLVDGEPHVDDAQAVPRQRAAHRGDDGQHEGPGHDQGRARRRPHHRRPHAEVHDKTPEGRRRVRQPDRRPPGKSREGIAIAAHYDSKKLADVPASWAPTTPPRPSSSCSSSPASSRPMPDRELTYYFIFFDGEEAFLKDWNDWERETKDPSKPDHLYGSRHFVKKMEDEGYPVKALVLLDMVGDKDYSLIEYSTTSRPSSSRSSRRRRRRRSASTSSCSRRRTSRTTTCRSSTRRSRSST